MSGLPKGWSVTKIQDVADVGTGATPKRGTKEFYESGTIPWITSGAVSQGRITYADEFITEAAIRSTNCKVFPSGTILVAMYGEGKTRGSVARLAIDAATNQALAAIVLPNDDVVSGEFLTNFLTSQYSQLRGLAAGGVQPNLNLQLIRTTNFPLPPLPEQKRIVVKLDALTAKSARARTELARIETLASRYKQAVLSNAFSGELSRSDARFGEFIHTAGNGLSKREGVEGEWTNVLRLTDLNQGQFSPTEPRQIRLTDKEVEKYRLAKGDVVIIRVNGSANLVGRSFCFKNDAQWAFCDHFIRVRLKPAFDPDFAALFLNSPPIRSIIEHKFVSTSGQKTISQKTLEELPAPQMSLEEQHEIIRRIESAFAKIDRLAVEARRALELVGRLDEAILAKAFRGELVPQDENDEPAEHLLARIRAERQAAPKAKRGRGAKA
ncbi:restriction endonuclease subunit S [Rhizobium leguminosarum]|uniref:restriction endonuclease subunit S n=1 Tax=Rhizobium leguminosarum TaxID=384 RepID=UPI001C94C01F|nr:restriction endonuclease subunit S [Rhizobium leguminosarum]MBY5608502.1 type I restriction endonuclease subunit S [Rhizobium leguminosarum]MBY5656741.1 type I restriction endonuclease subunit S [Rhizobium leguminosarum]